MSTVASNKKRKTEEDAPTGKPTYEELEAELLETKKKLVKAEEELKKRPAQEDDLSDGEDSVELDPNDVWNGKFLELRTYRIINGDCKVPQKNASLGQWVNNQRRAYANLKTGKKGLKITQERINMLDGLGFIWGKKYPAPKPWDENFEELKEYQKAMGHCNVTINANRPSAIAMWVSAQRSEYRRFKKGQDTLLNLELIGKLNDIGFSWKGPRLSQAK